MRGLRSTAHARLYLDPLPPELAIRSEAFAYLRGVETAPKHRGKGAATRLLREVLVEADERGVTLVLNPAPFGTPGPDAQQLADWYRAHGFRWLQREPVPLMWRKPMGGANGGSEVRGGGDGRP